jgi:hypothetical protein
MYTFREYILTRPWAFPKLVDSSFSETSPATNSYNCIAWAVGETHRWWSSASQYYWPSGASRGHDVKCLIEAYEQIGFRCCEDGDLETGVEKVAIYCNASGQWTHAARQLRNGSWTSKLGPLEDIQHEHPRHLEGPDYGGVFCYMSRSQASD